MKRTASARGRGSPWRFPVTVSIVLLAGCGDPGPTTIADTPELPACGSTVNLLVNPDFGRGQGDELAPWRARQHAGRGSFETEVAEGEVTIKRTGPEPWFTLTQQLAAEDLQGHRLLYVAELKLDLSAEDWPEVTAPGGGLVLTVWGTLPVAAAGERVVIDRRMDREPTLGTTEWFTAWQTVVLPQNATKLEVGFVHRAMGTLTLRNARLFDCGAEATP